MVKALSEQLNKIMLIDRFFLRKQLQQAAKIEEHVQRQQKYSELEQKITLAIQKVTRRRQFPVKISYPQNLPISEKHDEFIEIIKQHQVVIVAGETGSGKTTQLPKMCLELGRGIVGVIGHTQPRRLAARTVASRLASELETVLGQAVGYKIRFADQSSHNTLVKVMTDGILLAEIQQDTLLMQYDTLIIDEAHERSLNIDFLLGYINKILPKRPDLKVIITSATIDTKRFSDYFAQAPIIEISGRTYPVEVRYRPFDYLPQQQDHDLMECLLFAIDELMQEPLGDILIFLSGEREIRDTQEMLSKQQLPHTEVLPLYARLSSNEQNRIFQPTRGRRIVLATNVAETSLTVPGIKYVIDTGMARISRYSYRTKVQRLPIEPISQASANQRKGRCGRVAAGICIRLYAEEDFLSRAEFTEPEILRTNLASVILQMTALDLGDITSFPFVQAPNKRYIQDGLRLLSELGAIYQDKHVYRLTELGKQLAKLPLDPRLGRMVLAAQHKGCVKEIMVITAGLSIQDPRERPKEKQQAADEKHQRFQHKQSDFLSLVNLWNYVQEQQKILSGQQFRKLCQREYLNYLRIKEWQDIYTQIRLIVRELGLSINSLAADYQQVHRALLSGLLSHIGLKDQEKIEYTGARNVRFAIFPASGLFKKPPKWIMAAELVETSRLWARTVASIEAEWVESLALHLIKRHYSEPHWSKSQGAVLASERVTLYGLPIISARKVNYGKIDPELCHELFVRHALVQGEWQTKHPFFKHNQRYIDNIAELENKFRRHNILVDEETLFQFYASKVPQKIVSTRDFDSWWRKESQKNPELLHCTEQDLMTQEVSEQQLQTYPDNWQQGNFTLPLSYQFDPGSEQDGVTVHIPLAVLNQIQDHGFDWQIPALRRELIIALLKSLPKSLRRNFVPVPNYVDALLARIQVEQGSLLECLERELRKMTGVTVSRENWDWLAVPSYLKINFCIEDEQQTILQEGQSLAQLKDSLREQMQQALVSIVTDTLERAEIKHWDFDTLPTVYEKQQAGYKIKAYPTLIDQKNSVAIRLVETKEEQQQQMWFGLSRLLILTIPSPIKYLHEKLPNKAKLSLYFNPFGQILPLIDDCIVCGVQHLITNFGGFVWNENDFKRLYGYVSSNINQVVIQITLQIEQILTLAYQINKQLKEKVDMQLALALADIKTQLSQLIYTGFVATTGYDKLANLLRYLQAIERRLAKLPLDPQRDRIYLFKIEAIQQKYLKWLATLPAAQQKNEHVKAIRWMIEELRVSYFAQQLGTAYPISDKRILQLLQ